MDDKSYMAWRAADPVCRRVKFLRGTRDDIVIAGVATGRPEDRMIEGFVVRSNTPMYPVNYVSFGWVAESFEFVEGDLVFTEKPGQVAEAPAEYSPVQIDMALGILSGRISPEDDLRFFDEAQKLHGGKLVSSASGGAGNVSADQHRLLAEKIVMSMITRGSYV